MNTTLPKIVIGIDFGLKRIGLAIGQTITRSARPLETLAAKAGEPDWQRFNVLIKTWRPEAFVIGIPLNMDGTDQPITLTVREFANRLAEHYSLPVYPMDERLTTKAAREHLFNQGGFKALQDGQVDQVAAQLILENWFSENCL